MALKAGAAYVDVLADLKGLKEQLTTQMSGLFGAAGAKSGADFKKGLKQTVGNLSNVFPKGGLAGAIGAAGFALAAREIKQAADDTAALAEDIEDLSEVTGAGAEDASKLAAVMRAMGIDVGSAGKPFLTLSENIRTSNSDLKSFFDEAEFATLQSGELSAAVPILAEEFSTLGTQFEQNKFLVAAFGKRGAQTMRELLEATDGEIEKAIQLAEVNGQIFSQEQLDDARAYRIEMRELGESWDRLKTIGGKSAIPVLAGVSDAASDFLGSGIIERAARFGVEMNTTINPAFRFLRRYIEDGDDAAQGFGDTLGDLEDSAEEGGDAANELAQVYERAFQLAEEAATGFQKRLEGLVPSLEETFSGAKTPMETAEAIKDAAESVIDAEKRLADAREKAEDAGRFVVMTPDRQRDLAKAQEEVAEAERDLAEARKEAADAGSVSDIVSIPDLRKTLKANTKLLEDFFGDLSVLQTRFGGISTKGGEAIEQAFLGHLAALGPAAVPLLRELVNLTDDELKALAEVFGDEVKAAKKAADLQFDKFPPNFTEKIAAARRAAGDELQKLIGEFESLPAGADLSIWDQKMKDLALAIEAMSRSGLVSLSDVEEALLETALNADEPIERVDALKELIASLKGKTVQIVAEVHDEELETLLRAQSRENALRIFLEPVVATGEGGKGQKFSLVPTKPKDRSGAGDILGDATRHSGGPVVGGQAYRVLPGEQLLIPDRDGMVIPRGAPTHNKNSTLNITIGEVKPGDFNAFKRQMEQERQLAELQGF